MFSPNEQKNAGKGEFHMILQKITRKLIFFSAKSVVKNYHSRKALW